jgi:hypothetical protein
MGPKSISELLELAESLKEDLWYWMDCNKRPHEGLKTTVNELLDLIEELREK